MGALGARGTRSGKPCRSPATKKGRCRLHGGANGSGGPPGERNGQYRHGDRAKAAIAEQRKASALLKMLRAVLTNIFRCLDGRQSVRIAVLTIGGLQVGFWLYLFFYIAQHSNPKGDGMEWVAMAPATGVLVALVWPAL
jgi:hypothetical protein